MKFNDLNIDFDDHGRVNQSDYNLNKVVGALDHVSPSLCLAKFTQVTMHLGTGQVHSCHHPIPHKIPLDELKETPAALFNTAILKTARQEMLNGKRPAECDYCWRIEDNKNKSLSDRHLKSTEEWAITEYDNIVNSSGNEFFKPTYLEVSFGNTCNMKCVYCGPEFSSKWAEELKQQGPIKITDGPGEEQWLQGWQDLDNLVIPNRNHNPYIDAFWQWFPEIYPTLRHYRITGGEPLLNKNTLRSLDYVIDNPTDNLEISINTNLSVPDQIWNKFIEKIKKLEKDAKFKKITIFTSFESWGDRAAYARTGIEFNDVINRTNQLLEETSVRVVVMAAYNLLAITSFKEVLEHLLFLKNKYNTGRSRVGIDIPYVRYPQCLDVQYCDDSLIEYIQDCYNFMNDNVNNDTCGYKFEPYEVKKLERILKNRLNFKYDKNEINIMRAKFYDFVNALDKRRGMNFLETFPEMENFYRICAESKKVIK